MRKLNGLYVPENLLEENKEHIIVMNKHEFKDFVHRIDSSTKDEGSCCIMHYAYDKVYKEYIKEPIMYDTSNFFSKIEQRGKHVIRNLFNLLNINRKNSATPEIMYVVDGILRMYRTNNMFGKLVGFIDPSFEILIPNLITSWKEAYKEAEFYAENNITMYDLNDYNSIFDGLSLKFIDLDFYTEEETYDDILEYNIEAINMIYKCLIEFYFKDMNKNFECSRDDVLIQTKEYLLDTYEKLCLQAGTRNCKTLKEIGQHI